MDRDRSVPPSRRLSICHVNCQSLLPHIDELRLHIQLAPFHLICLSETWLRPEITDEMVAIPDYILLRRDRVGRRGGGVGLYVHRSLNASIISTSPEHYCQLPEFLIAEVKVTGAASLLLGIVYRPPHVGHLTVFEDRFVEILPDFSHAAIFGDFNTDLEATSFDAEHLRGFIQANSLHLVPHRATHHTATSSTRLDLCIVDQAAKVMQIGQYPVPFLSAHDLIHVVYDIATPPREPTVIWCRGLNGVDPDLLRTELTAVDWTPLYQAQSVDEKVSFLNAAITNAFDAHAPLRRIIVRRRPAPWITDELRELMRRRDRLRRAFVKTRRPHLHPCFIALRNEVKSRLKTARDEYFQRSIRAEASNTARTWSKLRGLGLIPSRSSAATPVFPLEALNAQFLSVGAAAPMIGNLCLAQADAQDAFALRPATVRSLEIAVRATTSNVAGVDGISSTMLSLVFPVLKEHILHVLNFSLSKCTFPSEWKRALVCPISKVTSPTSPADYRPISLLSVLSKAFERIIARQISAHLEANNLRDPYQSAFRPHHSTQSALIRIIDDARRGIDERKVTIIVLFDFSKAFDCIRFDLLLAKLSALNFSSTALRWFASYLSGRSQAVYDRDGNHSSWGALRSGVPQGSVLGPLLFSIFVDGCGGLMSSCKYSLYADDLQLYLSFPPDEVIEGIARINEDVRAVCEWAVESGLRLNSAKTKAILIGTARYVNALEVAGLPPIRVNAEIIPLASSTKCLGVTITSTLSWREHFLRVSGKINGIVYRLRAFRSRLSREVRLMLVRSLVLPHVDYCAALFTDVTLELDLKLQRALNRGVRLIFDVRRDEHITPFFDQLQWLKVAERRRYLLGTFVFALRTHGSPRPLFELVSHQLPVVTYTRRPRHELDCDVPRFRTERYRNSFAVSACTLWNSLPTYLRQSESLLEFRTAYRAFLLAAV